MRRVCLVVLLLGGLAAPGSTSRVAVEEVSVDPLRDSFFTSIAVIEHGRRRLLVPGTRIELEIHAVGYLVARAGCNHIGGTVRRVGDTFVLTHTAVTAMACPAEYLAQDRWFFRVVLDGRLRAVPTGPGVSELELTSGSTVIRLRSQPSDDQSPAPVASNSPIET